MSQEPALLSRPPLFRVSAELRRDGIFFVPFGFCLGLAQILGYRYLAQAELGAALLQEHIAPKSLGLITLLVWALRATAHLLTRGQPGPRLQALITHVATRAVALGSVAATITTGAALSALVFGACLQALVFLVAAAYFAALAEIAITPLRRVDIYRPGMLIAWTLMVMVPLTL